MLSFLDTLLQRREDGSLDVTVYRKPTHTFTLDVPFPSYIKKSKYILQEQHSHFITRYRNVELKFVTQNCRSYSYLTESTVLHSISLSNRPHIDLVSVPPSCHFWLKPCECYQIGCKQWN